METTNKQPADLDSYFADKKERKQSKNPDVVRIVIDVHKDTAVILCSAIGIELEERSTDKQIGVMLFRNALYSANGKVLPLLEKLSDEQKQRFAKDLSY